jgi:hypothetical protein
MKPISLFRQWLERNGCVATLFRYLPGGIQGQGPPIRLFNRHE